MHVSISIFGFLLVVVMFGAMARVIRFFLRSMDMSALDPTVDERTHPRFGRQRRVVPYRLSKVCPDPYCGRVNPEHARFCGQCGKRLPGSG